MNSKCIAVTNGDTRYSNSVIHSNDTLWTLHFDDLVAIAYNTLD